jgi:heptosyltransferase III
VEREQWPADQIAAIRSAASIAEPKSYLELFEVIQKANCFIGNDTGPTHLAAMSGVKTVALFGTDPTEWRPLGPRVKVLQKDGIENITLAEVASAVFEK